MKKSILLLFFLVPALCFARSAPKGQPDKPGKKEKAAVEALKGKVKGKIVWSTSRDGNHNIYIMNADGTDKKPLTKSKKTDWFSRISPDGQKVIFTRSRLDWTNEAKANYPKMWDTWIVNIDGSDEKKIIEKSTWATWSPDGSKIIFARGTDVLQADLDGSNEEKLIDGEKELNGGIAQNPHMSDDGKFMAITLRGSERAVGIFNMETRKWFESATGGGCQIQFFPNSNKVYRVNPTGRGGTQIYAYELKSDGTHGGKDMTLIDLPHRKSHEYFPQVSENGKWLVWAATARGHDHDIADYEIFIWDMNKDTKEAVRLTFHTGNDRWPHIWLEE